MHSRTVDVYFFWGTSGDGAGAVEAADDDAAAEEASSCTAPDEPAVDEHPATATVTSTNPTVSSFKRVLIAYPVL